MNYEFKNSVICCPDILPLNLTLNTTPQKVVKMFELSHFIFQKMFSLFWDQPIYRTYYACDPGELRRRQQRSRYLNYLQNQLASLVNDESDDFWDAPPRARQDAKNETPAQSESPSSQPQQQQQQQQQQHQQQQQQAPAESAESAESPRTPDETRRDTPKPRLTEYRYQSSTRYNGGDYVEEHRERYVAGDGSVHIRSRRRLGDKWHETEDHTDADGKSTQREIWHNVPDDQIDSFKQEWCDRHNPKPAIEQQSSGSPATPGASPEEKHD
jgi:hypothetical protein